MSRARANARQAYLIEDRVGSIEVHGRDATTIRGALFCDGSAVSRDTYSDLFDKIGTTWGVGDGSTTFNLPDLRETVPVGIGTRGSGITAHDIFSIGEFKDDQVQGHKHSSVLNGDHGHSGSADSNGDHDHSSKYLTGNAGDPAGGSTVSYVHAEEGDWGVQFKVSSNIITNGDHGHTLSINNNGNHNHSISNPESDGTNGTPRTDTTTRTKQVGIKFFIRYE